MIEILLRILEVTCGVGFYYVLVGIFNGIVDFMFGK